MKVKDKYGVFIIETLRLEDEKKRQDGLIIKDILDLCEIPNDYYYIRTSHELIELIKEFENSEFRYLHISCHADSSQLEFTFEALFFYEVAEIIKDSIKGKRVFISACEASNFNFAKSIVSNNGCLSLIGSPNKINFDKSAVFWSSFYHLMKENDERRMGQPEIKEVLQSLVNIHGMPINYYSFIRGVDNEIKENFIRPNRAIETTKRKIR